VFMHGGHGGHGARDGQRDQGATKGRNPS
jgi:hypothetical protein